MVRRREFLAGALPVCFGAGAPAPVHRAKVTPLFQSPDKHPNALEASPEGLWIGEQVTDRAYLVDWSGKLLRSVPAESSNTSGIAYGVGCESPMVDYAPSTMTR